MKITNHLNLPEPIVRAIENDPYNKGDADFSVTGLLKPPRIVALENQHRDELTVDVSDMIFSLFGQAVHTILERAGSSGISEKRLFMQLGAYKISTQLDHLTLLPDCTLQEWKTSSCWEIIHGLKPEREAQLNCQAAICRANGYAPSKLQAVMLLRDWSKSRAAREADYPQKQVAVLDVRTWSDSEVAAFLEDRIAKHVAARTELPLCTDDERWKKLPSYAVRIDGQKRAKRLLDNPEEAQVWGDQNLKGKRFVIDERAGEATRCLSYCDVGKAGFCAQWNAERPSEPQDLEEALRDSLATEPA